MSYKGDKPRTGFMGGGGAGGGGEEVCCLVDFLSESEVIPSLDDDKMEEGEEEFFRIVHARGAIPNEVERHSLFRSNHA